MSWNVVCSPYAQAMTMVVKKMLFPEIQLGRMTLKISQPWYP